MTTAGLVLAAGAGRRLGGPKALVRLTPGGPTLVETAVGRVRAAGCERVVVVVGAAGEQVVDAVSSLDVEVVPATDWAEGMGASLRAGLASLTGTGARAALVSLVDQPGIGPEATARVRAAYRDGTSLASAAYAGVRGHPVLLGAAHWAGIAASATGDRGARAYLAAHEGAITLVECGDVAEAFDIDTAADLGHLR